MVGGGGRWENEDESQRRRRESANGNWKNDGTVKITISRAKVRACRRIDCRSVERVSAPVLQRFTQRPREKGRENKRGSAPVTKRGSSEGTRRAHGGRRNIDRGREGMEEGETPSPPWSCCHRVGFQSSLPLGTRQAGTCFS